MNVNHTKLLWMAMYVSMWIPFLLCFARVFANIFTWKKEWRSSLKIVKVIYQINYLLKVYVVLSLVHSQALFHWISAHMIYEWKRIATFLKKKRVMFYWIFNIFPVRLLFRFTPWKETSTLPMWRRGWTKHRDQVQQLVIISLSTIFNL